MAFTPVFPLSGIATLLNGVSKRLAQVADRVEALSKALDGVDAAQTKKLAAQFVYLHRRSLALGVAGVLGATGVAATGASFLALFVVRYGRRQPPPCGIRAQMGPIAPLTIT